MTRAFALMKLFAYFLIFGHIPQRVRQTHFKLHWIVGRPNYFMPIRRSLFPGSRSASSTVADEEVYLARMLLDTIVIDDLAQARLSGAQEELYEIEKYNNVQIFPNPNKGVFTIDLGLIPESTVQVQVFDMVGKEIFSNFQNERIAIYSLERFASGVYLYVLTQENVQLSRGKLFIEK